MQRAWYDNTYEIIVAIPQKSMCIVLFNYLTFYDLLFMSSFYEETDL